MHIFKGGNAIDEHYATTEPWLPQYFCSVGRITHIKIKQRQRPPLRLCLLQLQTQFCRFHFAINGCHDITAKAEEEEAALVLVHSDSCKFTRSKTSHALREKETPALNLEGKSRSLSFHTVEEYDALLERIHGTRSLEDHFPWDDDDDFQVSTCAAEDQNEDSAVMVMEEGKLETGWKRKAIAKGLKSLDIEFPAATGIGKLKQQMLVQGQVYSPGTSYVTPKFGSYIDPATHSQQKQSQEDKDEEEEGTVFSPELLAAFEDCMQQLQLEEDTILRHMDHLVPNPSIM